MARTLPTPIKMKRLRRAILRSIYYRQNLPHRIVVLSSRIISAELSALRLSGFVRRGPERLELTEAGRNLLVELSGGRLPEMIDLQSTDLLPIVNEREFIVGGSLAETIFREVSLGE